MSKVHTIEISHETHELLEEVKKVFVSYTGDDIKEFTDDKVIEILASGFFDTEEDDDEEDHTCEHNGSCACKGEKGEKKEGCCGHHHH